MLAAVLFAAGMGLWAGRYLPAAPGIGASEGQEVARGARGAGTPPGFGKTRAVGVPAPRASRAVPQPAAGGEPRARVAIIFDDAGATLAQLDPILALGRPVTIAVLPGLPASQAVAARAAAAGLQVLLHLPLEAEETGRALGPGGITTDMETEAIKTQVRAGLAAIPGAVGVSGHMGSRATADRRVMAAVLAVVRERGLFFVDSRTTTRSVALNVARELSIPSAARMVFLDNEDDPAYIAGQLRQLIILAKMRGEAIGIGHVQKVTADVLRALLPEFERAGIVLVPVSSLVR